MSSELKFTVLIWKPQEKDLSQESTSFLCLSLTRSWKFHQLINLVQKSGKILGDTFQSGSFISTQDASYHLPAVANKEKWKRFCIWTEVTDPDDFLEWTSSWLEKVHTTTSSVFMASFKEFCPPASFSRLKLAHRKVYRNAVLRSLIVSAGAVLNWKCLCDCWLHALSCISPTACLCSWSYKSLWGALQEVKKDVADEQSSTLCGSK